MSSPPSGMPWSPPSAIRTPTCFCDTPKSLPGSAEITRALTCEPESNAHLVAWCWGEIQFSTACVEIVVTVIVVITVAAHVEMVVLVIEVITVAAHVEMVVLVIVVITVAAHVEMVVLVIVVITVAAHVEMVVLVIEVITVAAHVEMVVLVIEVITVAAHVEMVVLVIEVITVAAHVEMVVIVVLTSAFMLPSWHSTRGNGSRCNDCEDPGRAALFIYWHRGGLKRGDGWTPYTGGSGSGR
ncbi:hypothetical protein P7K49_026086 [Saguinus oedipus]|uniref:Uncharacterized protein n=1 Tax=Saguinus oedipus TaxID=9490 RepID=A0ABQ9UIZ8_SAGOE|nr:hypothetical protein P7K49_026086 [Saguinus oedipus]